ncbi:hypothetical protein [Chitinilyticum litopenaei]|uniref:hypothetical protein n=1 Tax=Chitinilyticum litopenaei TaxID=1121276 RepID=UPI00040150E3|nr:hypothetical protein [Chitinilyticum litopenaei]
MAYLDELHCHHCGFRAGLPLGQGASRYRADHGKTYRLCTQPGWCDCCDRHTLFEQFDDAGLQVVRELHQRQQRLVASKGRWFRLLRRRGAFARMSGLLAAYAVLLQEEAERTALLAARQVPCCLSCGSAAKPDAFAHAGWTGLCRKCGGGVERVELARLHLRRSKGVHFKGVHFYSAAGKQLEEGEWPEDDLLLLREARQKFEWELLSNGMAG